MMAREYAIREVVGLLKAAMLESGMSRGELALTLGTPLSWVIRLLDNKTDKDVRGVADAFAAMGKEYHPMVASKWRPVYVTVSCSTAALTYS